MKYPVADTIRQTLAKMLFPQICLICGCDSGLGHPLCDACFTGFLQKAESASFTKTDTEACLKCGRPLISSSVLCTTCRNAPIFSAIDRIIPLYGYNQQGQELLATWKIHGMRGLSGCFSRWLAIVLRFSGLPPDVTVIPVPPRPGKMREKGWDQIEELVSLLEKDCSVKILRGLRRTGGLQQKKLGRLARTHNLKGYIEVIEGQTLPDTVVLLDDLMTTGATLDSCAEALKSAGCRKVYGLTLFYD